MQSLVVSIINFRTGELTIASAKSVIADLDSIPPEERPRTRIVIIDNASGDGSAEDIQRWMESQNDERLCFLQSGTNSGFSGGHNQVIEGADSKLVLLLNSDAYLATGCIAGLLNAAEDTQDAGIFSPRIERPDGSICDSRFRFPGVISEFIRGANSGPITKLLSRWQLPLDDDAPDTEARWCEFSCVLLRRDLLDSVGPLDEGFFLYFEDVEFCLRAWRSAWKICFVQDATATHLQGGSSTIKDNKESRGRMPRYYYASRTRYFYLRVGLIGLWSANIAWLLGRVICEIRRLVGLGGLAAARGEYRDIWINGLNPLGQHSGPGETG